MAEAVKLTSGSHRTKKDLRKAGHPFKRDGRLGRLGAVFQTWPLLPIGQMSSDLVNKWRIFRRSTSDGTAFRLQNLSSHARYVLAPGGTKRMVDRQFWQQLNTRTKAKVKQAQLTLFRAALKG